MYFISVIHKAIDQVDKFAKKGLTLNLRNAHTRVDRTGHIKLNVDIWGKIEESKEPIHSDINRSNNVSEAEYEAVFSGGSGGGGGDRRGGGGGPSARGGSYGGG